MSDEAKVKLFLFQLGDKPDMEKEWKIVAGKHFHDAALTVVREHVVVPFDQLLAPVTYRVHLIERDAKNPNLVGVPRKVHTMKIDIGN